MFGGPFDIETFRNQKNVCYIVHPPFVSYCMLIEERQPIESIGESNVSQARGTVKGLRRPESGSVVTTHDEFASPEDDGLYAKFLQEKGNDMTNDTNETVAPAPKKQKKTEKKAAGLERFMTTN